MNEHDRETEIQLGNASDALPPGDVLPQKKDAACFLISRKIKLMLFLAVLIPCVWFFHAGHINQTARYDAIQAFFENTGENAHTFRIDRYLFDPERRMNTTDWSFYAGHYYSNKSPGTTWFGIALLAPVYPVERLLCPSGAGISPYAEIFNAWYLNFMMSVLPTAFSVLGMLSILLRLGFSETKAVFGALLTVLGTALFPYSITLLAHTAVAACLIFSLERYLKGTRRSLFWSGAFFAAAVLLDYSAGILLPMVVPVLLWKKKKESWRFFAGAVPFACLYCLYNQMCFGSPFSFAAQFINPIYKGNGMAGMVSPWIPAELLIGVKRGVLLMMPFFVFAFPGFAAMWKRGGFHRQIALLCAGTILLLLAMNSFFNGWHGGATTVARYMIPAFPAWAILALSALLKRPKTRWLFLLTVLISLMNMFAIACYTPMTSEPDPSPLYSTTYAHLFDTHAPSILKTPLALHAIRKDREALARASTFTLGELLGMNYGVSRILLFVILCGFCGFFVYCSRDALKRFFLPAGLKIPHIRTLTALVITAMILTLLFPGAVPWGVRESSVCFARNPFDSNPADLPFAGLYLGQGFFSVLALFSKNILILAFLKTLLVMSATVFCLKKAAEILNVNWDIPVLLLFASPYAVISMKSMDAASLMLPVGAALLLLFSKPPPPKWAVFTMVAASLLLILFAPGKLACLEKLLFVIGYAGFSDTFCSPGLNHSDPGANITLIVAAFVSSCIGLTAVSIGIFNRKRGWALLLCAIVTAKVGLMYFGSDRSCCFSAAGGLPFLCILAADGARMFRDLLKRLFPKDMCNQILTVLLAVYVVFSMLVWVMFLGMIRRDSGTAELDRFGSSLGTQQALVWELRDMLIRKGVPQDAARFVAAKQDIQLLKAFTALYRMNAVCAPYTLSPSSIVPQDKMPSVMLCREESFLKTGELKIMLYYDKNAPQKGALPPSSSSPSLRPSGQSSSSGGQLRPANGTHTRTRQNSGTSSKNPVSNTSSKPKTAASAQSKPKTAASAQSKPKTAASAQSKPKTAASAPVPSQEASSQNPAQD